LGGTVQTSIVPGNKPEEDFMKWNKTIQYGNTIYTMEDNHGNIRYKVEKIDNGKWKALSQFSLGTWKKTGIKEGFSTAKSAKAYCENCMLSVYV
jgi:D-Tyr-tRNAtyr deacylase